MGIFGNKVKEILIHNLDDVIERLGESKETVIELARTGQIEVSEGGFLSEQSVSNLLTHRRIERELAAQNAASDRRQAYYDRLWRQQRVLAEIVHEYAPKVVGELRKRIDKADKEVLMPEVERQIEHALANAAARVP